MSLYYMKNGKRYVPKYGPSRTKQSFKDSTDINKILKKAQKMGGLAHVEKYPEAVYGEFAGFDLLEAWQKVERANEIFDALPSEVRNEFGNDALGFAGWASKLQPGELEEKIPAIAEPGRYFPNPRVRGGQGAGAATAPAEGPAGAENIAPQAAPLATEGGASEGSSEPQAGGT